MLGSQRIPSKYGFNKTDASNVISQINKMGTLIKPFYRMPSQTSAGKKVYNSKWTKTSASNQIILKKGIHRNKNSQLAHRQEEQ